MTVISPCNFRYGVLSCRHGNSVLTVIYHLLSDPDATFCDLGPGYYESQIIKYRRARDLATQLQALTGQHIAIRDGKAVVTNTAAYRFELTSPPGGRSTTSSADTSGYRGTDRGVTVTVAATHSAASTKHTAA